MVNSEDQGHDHIDLCQSHSCWTTSGDLPDIEPFGQTAVVSLIYINAGLSIITDIYDEAPEGQSRAMHLRHSAMVL
jgi:hypothetical protein